MSVRQDPDLLQGSGNGSDEPSNKRQRRQATLEPAPATQPSAMHMHPGASAGIPAGSLLNVQNLYLAQAPINQAGILNRPQATPSLLHLTQQLEQDQQHQHQQHLGAPDQLDQQQELLGRLDDADTVEGGMPLPSNTDYKHKPRRKATERPSGTDQIRQAFSKRKRGLALKCYQLHKLTDAKVFCFIMKEKGTSWAYATPGFGASLSASNLRQLRQLTGFEQASDATKQVTEIMSHPAAGDADDRDAFVSPVQQLLAQPSASLVGGADFDPEPDVLDHGATREIGVQVTSHIQTIYPSMAEIEPPTAAAQPPTDEVRNFVTELAHLAYSRGVPAGPMPTPAGAGDATLATPPSSSGHIMQQAMLNLPPHLTPGHPSFDQHAYQLLLQQQHQQPQMPPQQQHPEQHHQQHQDASVQSDLDGSINAACEGQDAEQTSEARHDAHAGELDLASSAH